MSLIGILGTPYNVVERQPFWWNKVSYTRQSFIDVLQELGHQVIILPVDKPEIASQYVSIVDKILLTGGTDIAPQFYNQEPHLKIEATNLERDAFEMAAVEAALEQGKAIFGVCRGLQLLNVFFGGSLWQDLSEVDFPLVKHLQAPTPEAFPTHSLVIQADSYLDFLPSQHFVNSFHHQAVRKLAPELRAIAHAADGLVEAVENHKKRVLAVQWHPEATWQTEKYDKELFRFFAEEL